LSNLKIIYIQVGEYDVVAIEEVQFFGELPVDAKTQLANQVKQVNFIPLQKLL
jgi:thymidine kinase